LVFEKNANLFAENCRKSQKIVIITSTPGANGKKSRFWQQSFRTFFSRTVFHPKTTDQHFSSHDWHHSNIKWHREAVKPLISKLIQDGSYISLVCKLRPKRIHEIGSLSAGMISNMIFDSSCKPGSKACIRDRFDKTPSHPKKLFGLLFTQKTTSMTLSEYNGK
jgi:hypothetical protein